MENSEHKGDLIPFSKELWETGEYEAELEQSKGVPVIYEIHRDRVYGRIGVTSVSWDLSGKTDNMFYTLMLRKKTKKVWIPTFKQQMFDNKEECESVWKDAHGYKGAIEVEI